jgi:hypothetical protein
LVRDLVKGLELSKRSDPEYGMQDPIQRFGSPTVNNDPEHSVLRSQLEEVKARLKAARTEVVRLEQVGAFTITYFTFCLLCL